MSGLKGLERGQCLSHRIGGPHLVGKGLHLRRPGGVLSSE